MALKRVRYGFSDSQTQSESDSDSSATSSTVVYEGGDVVEVTPVAEMQRILKCPVCYDVSLPPIFNCSLGHTICGECRPKVLQCGICRSEYTGSRNFSLEEIVRTSKMACKFREHGCNLSLTGLNFKKHLEDCEFRPMKCIFGRQDGCNGSDVCFENYTRHLEEVHKLNSSNSEKGCLIHILRDSAETDCSWHGKKYLLHEGKAFLPRSFLRNDIFHFTLAIVGSELDASKYTVKLRLWQPGDAKTRMECVVPVVSVQKSTDEITEELHFLLTKVILKNSICKIVAVGGGKEMLIWHVQYMILSE